MPRSSFGQELAAAREARGLTQYELARWIGISQSSLCRWERGSGYPGLLMLARIVRVTGADPAKLLGKVV